MLSPSAIAAASSPSALEPSNTERKKIRAPGGEPSGRGSNSSTGLGFGHPHFPQPVDNPPNEGCHWSAEKRRIRRRLPTFGAARDGGADDKTSNGVTHDSLLVGD
jgi:hypothetical protein